jgi:hypothetical protein
LGAPWLSGVSASVFLDRREALPKRAAVTRTGKTLSEDHVGVGVDWELVDLELDEILLQVADQCSPKGVVGNRDWKRWRSTRIPNFMMKH